MKSPARMESPEPNSEVTRHTGEDEAARLLARAGAGETAALAAIYQLWGDRLFSMACQVLRDEGAAREAVQDCFLAVWKGAAGYDPAKAPPFAWCAMILRARCFDHLRARGRRAAVWLDGESPETRVAPGADGLEDLLFHETITRVQGALARLDPEDARYVRAAVFDPGTVADHARRWGVPLGTAKIRIHRALTKLRALIQSASRHESE